MSKSPFLEDVRRAMRVRHYSIRTEQSYLHWIKRFIYFHNRRHPEKMGEAEVGDFLTHLAVDRNVTPSTQNQALNALVFLYKGVLNRELGLIGNVQRAKKPSRLPVVLSREEVRRVLANLEGEQWKMVSLLYGSGLRLMECLRLRVKDLDFDHRAIIVREGKGNKDRVTILPDELIPHVKRHLEGVRFLHQRDLEEGFGKVYLPYALERKYPNANREWGWQYVFPMKARSPLDRD